MEVTEVKAHVKPESLTTAFSSTDNVTGIIYFSVGSSASEDVWDDFPVTIVGWWLNALAEYMSGDGPGYSAELPFMDGPFYVLVSLGSERSIVRVEMIESMSSGSDKVLRTAMSDPRVLYSSIDEVADDLIQFCDRQPTKVSYFQELIEAKKRARAAFVYRYGQS